MYKRVTPIILVLAMAIAMPIHVHAYSIDWCNSTDFVAAPAHNGGTGNPIYASTTDSSRSFTDVIIVNTSGAMPYATLVAYDANGNEISRNSPDWSLANFAEYTFEKGRVYRIMIESESSQVQLKWSRRDDGVLAYHSPFSPPTCENPVDPPPEDPDPTDPDPVDPEPG